jgi:cell division protein FtsL
MSGLKWWVSGVVVLGLLLAITWVRETYRQTSYEISQLNDQYQILLQKQAILKTELEQLRSPARIMRIAREKLDLKDPSPEQIRVIP